MKPVRLLIFWVLTMILGKVSAQNNAEIDSLQNLLRKYDTERGEQSVPLTMADSQKVNLLNALCAQYFNSDPDSVLSLTSECLKISSAIHYHMGILRAYFNLGIYYQMKGKYKEAIVLYREIANQGKKMKNARVYAGALSELGEIARITGDYDRSLEYFLEAAKIQEESKLGYNLITTLNNLALLYQGIGKNKEALSNYRRVFRISDSLDIPTFLPAATVNIGIVFRALGDPDSARFYFFQGYHLCAGNGNYMYAGNALSNLGVLYMDAGNSDSAFYYFNLAAKLSEEAEYQEGIMNSSLNLSSIYIDRKKFSDAKRLLDKGLLMAKSSDMKSVLPDFYKGYVDLYYQQQKWEDAFRALKEQKESEQALLDSERSENLYSIQLKYNLEKQQAIDSLRSAESLLNARNHIRRQKTYYLTGTFFLIALFVIGYLYFSERKKREQQAALLAERSRISRELHDDVGSTLSSIRMMAEIAGKKSMVEGANIAPTLESIKNNTSQIQEKMGDLVWALQEENRSITDILTRLRKWSSETAEAKGIQLNFNIEKNVETIAFKPQVLHAIYLISKEAINNAFKYSESQVVEISMKVVGDEFVLEVSDHGIGFDRSVARDGNGLRTMKKRAEDCHGKIEIISSTMNGVRVKLLLPTT